MSGVQRTVHDWALAWCMQCCCVQVCALVGRYDLSVHTYVCNSVVAADLCSHHARCGNDVCMNNEDGCQAV